MVGGRFPVFGDGRRTLLIGVSGCTDDRTSTNEVNQMTRHTGLWLLSLLVVAAASIAAPAKRVIVMVGDGMGINHVIATRQYLTGGRLLEFERFPVRRAMTTYSVNGSYDPVKAWGAWEYLAGGATDSAAAATALASGIKTYNGGIGVDKNGEPLLLITELFEIGGRSTGVVTSVQFSHATPAGFVAHNKKRGNMTDIALEMIERSAVDVIMGAGHPLYDTDGKPREPKYDAIGQSLFERLKAGTAGGDANGDGQPDPWTFVDTADGLKRVPRSVKRLFFLAPVASTLQQARTPEPGEKEPYSTPLLRTVPTLGEMSAVALDVLNRNPKGFFLMIEGGAIDWASHGNLTNRMLEEVIDFDVAVRRVCRWIERNGGWDDTLLVVTADHETGYLWGAGSGKDTGWKDIPRARKGQMPDVSWNSTGHTNTPVGLWAKGAGAEYFLKIKGPRDTRLGPLVDNTDVFSVARKAGLGY